jgi:type I restriction-modification system DNA methylase subunit
VRQVQSLAVGLGARYFLLTDAETFLWFTTDSSGRPQLLDQPVQPFLLGEARDLSSSERIESAFWKLGDLFRDEIRTSSSAAAIILLAKILEERGDSQWRGALLSAEQSLPIHFPQQVLSPKELPNRDLADRAFEILDTISLTDAAPRDVLRALDDAFLQLVRRRDFFVSRWLADFLISMGQLNSDSSVLDINSHYGNIMAAALMSPMEGSPRSVWGISRTSQGKLWPQVQMALLATRKSEIFMGGYPPYEIQRVDNAPKPTHIISVPPFGDRIDRPNVKSRLLSQSKSSRFRLEELYLELALDWIQASGRVVLILPEGLMFRGGNSQKIREIIYEDAHITAIISLPHGALKPFTGIKSSVLIVDKIPANEPYDIFMAVVEEFSTRDTFDCQDIPQVARVLKEFSEWTEAKRARTGSVSWGVSSDVLEIENWGVNRYLPIELSDYEALTSAYPMVPLERIVKSIKRGSSIKLTEEGDVPVISAAAIRPMILDTSTARSTVKENIPKRALGLQVGDLVLISTGPHLGTAAAIDEKLADTYLNQHVIRIRPNTTEILPEYLAAALNSDFVKPEIERRATGTLMPSISVKHLSDIKIPLPDQATQQRIVSAMQQVREEIKEKKKKLEQAEAKFEKIVQRLTIVEGDER